jgi:hypothetical protein
VSEAGGGGVYIGRGGPADRRQSASEAGELDNGWSVSSSLPGEGSRRVVWWAVSARSQVKAAF